MKNLTTQALVVDSNFPNFKKFILALFLSLFSAGSFADPLDKAYEAHKIQNYVEAVKWYTLAAEQGNAEAQLKLGEFYYKGQDVPKDNFEAIKWFRLAAAQGHAKAQFMLGTSYQFGNGVFINYFEAIKWYRLAAVQGFEPAQMFLGMSYEIGQGVPKDYMRAYMWYNIAGASGNSKAIDARDRVTEKMAPGQIGEAQKLASECFVNKLVNCN